ncbi:hypothetical protein LINPERPRIM_LOCUS2889 [Linum perenne]
MQQLFVNIGDC